MTEQESDLTPKAVELAEERKKRSRLFKTVRLTDLPRKREFVEDLSDLISLFDDRDEQTLAFRFIHLERDKLRSENFGLTPKSQDVLDEILRELLQEQDPSTIRLNNHPFYEMFGAIQKGTIERMVQSKQRLLTSAFLITTRGDTMYLDLSYPRQFEEGTVGSKLPFALVIAETFFDKVPRIHVDNS